MNQRRDVKLSDICARLTGVRSELAHLLEFGGHPRPLIADASHAASDELIDIALLSVDAAIEALIEVASARRLKAADTPVSGSFN